MFGIDNNLHSQGFRPPSGRSSSPGSCGCAAAPGSEGLKARVVKLDASIMRQRRQLTPCTPTMNGDSRSAALMPDGPELRSPTMTFSTVFHELAAILMIAGVIGIVALKPRQPLLIGYILTGIAVLLFELTPDVTIAKSMAFLWFFLVGLIAGWLAGVLVKGGGFGLIGRAWLRCHCRCRFHSASAFSRCQTHQPRRQGQGHSQGG